MEAKRDSNQIPTALATLNTDGTTPIRVKIEASAHAVLVDDNSTGSDFGGDVAVRDNNGEPVMLAVSSSDGITPVFLYANSDGSLLINSN